MHDTLKSHYTLEDFGRSIALLPKPEEDRKAKVIMEKLTRRISDRFVASLLGKKDNAEFPNSCPMMAVEKFMLEKRLRMDPEIYAKIRAFLQLHEIAVTESMVDSTDGAVQNDGRKKRLSPLADGDLVNFTDDAVWKS